MTSDPPDGPRGGGPTDAARDAHQAALRAGGECLEAALDYESRGWSALIVCPPDHVGVGSGHARSCASPGKAPFGAWKKFQTERASAAQIRDRWREKPTFNVGVALGPVSGLVGIDIDGEEGERLVREASAGDLPPTLEFTSGGGGRRLLYRLPPGASLRPTHQPGGDRHEGFSLLGEGAQTVMPPSRHKAGTRYAWVPGRGPGEIEPAAAPGWLLALMSGGANGRHRNGRAPALADGELITADRNVRLTSLAGTMRRRGMDEEEICPALEAVNRRRCDPPLDGDEVAGIARKICRYEPEAPLTGPGGGDEAHLTDRGNALRLVREHGRDLRHVHPWRKWLVWDGRRWRIDDRAAVTRRAKGTIVGLFRSARQEVQEIERELERRGEAPE
jgi:putative DNA primase/helicase